MVLFSIKGVSAIRSRDRPYTPLLREKGRPRIDKTWSVRSRNCCVLFKYIKSTHVCFLNLPRLTNLCTIDLTKTKARCRPQLSVRPRNRRISDSSPIPTLIFPAKIPTPNHHPRSPPNSTIPQSQTNTQILRYTLPTYPNRFRTAWLVLPMKASLNPPP